MFGPAQLKLCEALSTDSLYNTFEDYFIVTQNTKLAITSPEKFILEFLFCLSEKQNNKLQLTFSRFSKM